MAIKVAIADDSVLVLEGLQQLLGAQPGIEVVASCDDMPSLLRAVEDVRPDVVVSDIRMPPSKTDEGIQVALRLRQDHPEVGVVILSQYAEPRYALKLLETGSKGRAYLLKEHVSDPAQLVSAIESVAAGESVIDPKVVDVLVAAKTRPARTSLAEAHPARAGGPCRDRPRQEQYSNRQVSGAQQTSRREAHPLDLLQARSLG